MPKRKRILEVTVKVDRLASDDLSDAENDKEVEQVMKLFQDQDVRDDINVHVVDRHGDYLYTPYGEEPE